MASPSACKFCGQELTLDSCENFHTTHVAGAPPRLRMFNDYLCPKSASKKHAPNSWLPFWLTNTNVTNLLDIEQSLR